MNSQKNNSEQKEDAEPVDDYFAKSPFLKYAVYTTLPVAVVVLFSAIGLYVYLVHFSATKAISPPTYFFLLTLIFFSMTTLGAIIFFTRASGSFKLIDASFHIGGPAVAWIICLIAFKIFIVDDKFFGQERYDFSELPLAAASYDRKLGWYDYSTWEKVIPDQFRSFLHTSRGEDFLNNLRSVLSRKHPQGGDEDQEQDVYFLKNCKIDTLFLYLDTEGDKLKVFKFQIITGTNTQGKPVYLPFRAMSSTKDQATKLSLFFRGYDAIEDSPQGTSKVVNVTGVFSNPTSGTDFIEVTDTNPNVLIVAYYDDFQRSQSNDWIFVDTRSFVGPFSATSNLSVMSDRPITESDLWMARAPHFMHSHSPVQASFSVLRSNVNAAKNQLESGALHTWLKVFEDKIVKEAYSTGESEIMPTSNIKNQVKILCNSINRVLNDDSCDLRQLLLYSNIGDQRNYQRNYTIDAPSNVVTLLLKFGNNDWDEQRYGSR